MASTADLLLDAFGRIREGVIAAAEDLTPDQLSQRLDPEANSIAWLLWHLTRVQDDHVADVAGSEQAWTAEGWDKRFELPFRATATGYGHRAADVAAVRVESPDLLIGYHGAVHKLTVDYVSGLADADLDRVVDTSWDPPVTLAVRLISVVNDATQHAGQAAYVRGVVLRGERRATQGH